ncbi:hypothetical protein FOZ63_032517, partial [Perkinsus olseni]
MFKPSLYWLYYYLVALPRVAITIPLRPGLSTIDITLVAPLTGIDSYYYSVAALDIVERWSLKVNMDPAFPFRVVPSHIDTRGINATDVEFTARLISTSGTVDGGTIHVIGWEGMETHGTQGIILDPGFIDKPCENRGQNMLCAPRPSFDMGYTPHDDNTTETCAHHLLQEIMDQDPRKQRPVYLDMQGLGSRLGAEDLLSEARESTTVLYCGHIAGLHSVVLQSINQQMGDRIHWVLVEPSGRGCGASPSLPFPRIASISCIAPPTYEPLDSLAQQLVLVEDISSVKSEYSTARLPPGVSTHIEITKNIRRAAVAVGNVLPFSDRHSAALR